MIALRELILVAAAIGAASIMTTSANAEDSCGSVTTVGKKYTLNVQNASKDPIWYTVYNSRSRSGKSNWGCVMPGQTAEPRAYSCGGGGYWVLGEQKRGSDCGGGNVSEPIYNVTLPANNRGMIIFKNNSRGERIWADTSKWR